jgi:NAD(P)-dependent dehydrogenase (short-subunit alcohol dehydrogenase family)
MSSKPVALVTGGTRGIGLAIALELARSGFNVAINGRRPESDVSDALGAIEGEGAQAAYVRGDIGDDDSRSAILDAIRERFGRLDTLVNNAGVAPDVRADITEMSEASYDRVMGINLRGPFFLTQAVARWMLEQRQADNSFRGSIINVSSVSATVVSTNRGEYCISKAGIAMATQLWAARLSDHGIGVFELRPGVIETDMTSGVKEKYDALFEQGLTVERRWGKPEDVGRAAAMLARGELTYATGQVITIDGGLTLPRL